MRSSIWLRLIRGMFATLLVLTASGMPHHHADHDGNLVHVDEAHGSHGSVRALDVIRAPAVEPTTLPVAIVQAIAAPR